MPQADLPAEYLHLPSASAKSKSKSNSGFDQKKIFSKTKTNPTLTAHPTCNTPLVKSLDHQRDQPSQ
jgi:hypothetical protein